MVDAPSVPTFISWTSESGMLSYHLDTEAFDFHYDIDYSDPSVYIEEFKMLLDLEVMGYEPIPEEECPAEISEDGRRVRTYLVPIEPVSMEGMA